MVSRLHLLWYLFQVSRELPGSWKEKKNILLRMECSIRDYVSEGTVVSYRQIIERFGEPQQVAATYVAEMDTKELLCAIQTRNRTQRMIKFVVFAVVIIWFGFHLLAYIDHVKDTNGYAVVEIVEYERIEIDEGGE